ncbi:cell wall hydrolase [Paenibacillus selenitireducens]|uniref:Cell wall hydrolase n=1 Tax=Paenibacillus selenitireducens TaxID=1324314 RepID=A0A1T2WZ63_9BACL|nr:N-acetylmuramoyl-L-alanine amidase family protein [Paenibacillus selenitireducens]OPA72865.1 cell wall hydrolase [Paenibacillus selenitireducens]
MKKIGGMLLFCFMLFMVPNMSHASAGLQIYLNGVSLSPSAGGQIIKDYTMIPIRVVVEELGFQVDWDKKTRTVTIHNDKTSMTLVVDQKWATVDGKKVSLDMPPTLKSDTTLVPLRFVGEQMGLVVNWENATKSVYLFTSDYSSEVTKPDVPTTPGKPDQGGSTGEGSNNGSDGTNNGSNGSNGGNSGNGSVTQDLAEIQTVTFEDNRLVVGVSKSDVKPTQTKLSNPDRIVVDIPNAKFSDSFFNSQNFAANGQAEIQLTDHPLVSKIRYSLFSSNPSTVRIVIDLNQNQAYQFTTTKDPNTIIVDLNGGSTDPGNGSNPGTIPPANGKYVVVIDAGHGAKDPGAISLNKRNEKDFNLAQALKVAELFQNDPDVQIVLTRSDDTFLELKERVTVAKQANANLFISIHANSINKATISGTETYYSRDDESKAFAQVMHSNLVQGTKLPDRGVRKQSLHVTRETTMPACLLEVGYLTNQTDEAALYQDDFQNRVAQSIKNGIKQYLGLQP